MEYEVVVGLEVHAQLLTKSKMFCGCSSEYQDGEPNSVVCPVCMGMPGVLPVINKKAVEHTIRTGLALGCTIARNTKFDRKNYPYPDLMKGYQISQFDMPVASDGCLEIQVDGQTRSIGVTRVHLEEDAAKLLHRTEDYGEGYSLLDINRAGVPLMEIVGEPDLRSADEAREYLVQLHTILQFIGTSVANMEEGNFRCDANVSVRPVGQTELTTKVEVKNMNRIRAVVRAIEHEIERQIAVVESGERVVQETRGWDDGKGVTIPQRSKEEAHDYRFFPEPDIPPLVITEEWIDSTQAKMPELPIARKDRFVDEWGLNEYDADLLTAVRSTADYFEEVCAGVKASTADVKKAYAKEAANWLNGEMARMMNNDEISDMSQTRVKPAALATLVEKFRKRELNNNSAKQVFEVMYTKGTDPETVIKDLGLGMVSGADSLGPVVDKVIENNEKAVVDFLAGKEASLKFLMGQVMKATRGQADAAQATEMIREKLATRR